MAFGPHTELGMSFVVAIRLVHPSGRRVVLIPFFWKTQDIQVTVVTKVCCYQYLSLPLQGARIDTGHSKVPKIAPAAHASQVSAASSAVGSPSYDAPPVLQQQMTSIGPARFDGPSTSSQLQVPQARYDNDLSCTSCVSSLHCSNYIP